MKLNTKVWSQGTNNIYDMDFPDNSVYVPTYYSIYNGVSNGRININTELDPSIFLGVKFNSKLSSAIYAELTPTNGKIITQNVGYSTANPMLCVYSSLQSVYNSFDDFNLYRLGYGVTNYVGCPMYPVVKMPLNRLIFLISVEYIPKIGGNENTIYRMSYHDFENMPPENKNQYDIIGIDLTSYYGTKTARNKSNYNDRFAIQMVCTRPRLEISNEPTENNVYFSVGNGPFMYSKNPKPSFLVGGYCTTSSKRVFVFPSCDPDLFEIAWAGEHGGNHSLFYTRLKNGWHDLYLLKNMINELGVYYCTKIETAMTAELGENCTDDDVMCGANSDGNLTGQTLTGANTTKSPIAKMDKPDDFENNGFTGNDKTDPNAYTDKIDLNKPTLSNVNVFNRSFAVNSNDISRLADFLWNADETKFQEIVKGLALMGENPMNGIIDLRLFPFNVALKNSATQAEPIVIGRTNTGVNGIKLTENVNCLIDLGECTFFEKFKNFLDFEPYTTAQLYIPYIGVVPVSTAEFMGHKISAKMLVDYTTGAGTAIIFKDDIPFIYKNGVVGITIPMTGNDSASYANTVVGNVVNGAVGGISSIASGNIGGVVSSAEKLYSGFATGTNYQTASASAPAIATWQPQKCYFIIDRPILNAPDNYGRTVGYACEITGKLSDFKGFTVVSNPEISFKCTETEKTMLSQLLTAGVFI